MLLLVFFISVAELLLCITKIKLNPFVAGVSILLFTCILSLFQGFLPGLVRFDATGKEVCLLLKTGFFSRQTHE